MVTDVDIRILKDNSKTFDNKYIKLKNINIFCSSTTLIHDYLIAKSAITDDMRNIVYTSMISHFKSIFLHRIKQCGLESQLSLFKSTRSHTLIEFKNGSRIQFVDKFSGKDEKINLIHVKNDVLSALILDEWWTVALTMLQDNGRIIYNFDI